MACSLQLLNDIKHWLDRAEEARIQAEHVSTPEAKRIMFDIAKGYMRLAERAQERNK